MEIYTRDQAWAAYEGTEYGEKHKVATYPEGFAERLEGKTIEEQLRLFAVIETVVHTSYSYGEVDKWRSSSNPMRVEKLGEFRGVIVENGLVEGIMVKDDQGNVIALGPNNEVCTYYSCDDDGTGGSSRNDSVALVCLSPEDEWE